MASFISINFTKPMALLPLPGVVLLPHTALPLHIFEPRYRQMVDHALGNNPDKAPVSIAVATIRPDSALSDRDPPVREIVCVAHIVQHHKHPDGKYDIVLQGLCRASIERIDEPDGQRLYRQAQLNPLEFPLAKPRGLGIVRKQVRQLLSGMRLQRMQSARAVLQLLDNKSLSNEGALELVAFALVKNDDLRYQILSERDPYKRARIVWADLDRTDRLLAKALMQVDQDLPRGVNWN